MRKLSQRLLHLSDLVTEGSILADVGTDHGYLPIYLLRTGKIRRAFAMDIGNGPLLRAKEHIEAYGMGDYITLRRSDGVAALKKGEADTILISGMGGGVMLHILKEGEEVVASAKEIILQPQSEIDQVRRYLYEKKYVIDREDIVLEDGKFYPMMHIDLTGIKICRTYTEDELPMIYRYGEPALYEGNEVYNRYLLYKREQYKKVLENLMHKKGEAVFLRRKNIEAELSYVTAAFNDRKEERKA